MSEGLRAYISPSGSAEINAAIARAQANHGQVAIIRFPPQDPLVVEAITKAVREAGQKWIKDEHVDAWMGRSIPSLAGLTPVDFARLFDVDLLIHVYERGLRAEDLAPTYCAGDDCGVHRIKVKA